jgi:hypothetical protein
MIKCTHKRIFFIVICFCSLCSCEKSDKPTSLKGFVTDFYSNNPVNSYRLKIMRARNFSLDGMDGLVDSIKTDSNGLFQISLVCEHGFSYTLESNINKVYSPIEEKVIEPGKANDYNFTVKHFNILKLDIRNKAQKYNQILVLSNFWNRWDLHDTIVYINDAIPEENYKLMIYLYKIRNSGQEDSVVNNNVWIERKDTAYYKIEL